MSRLREIRPTAVALAVTAVLLATAAVAMADPPSFATGGAFTLGDATVAAATPADTVTWWSHSWWKENSLSGGLADPSFKGYATDFAGGTPTCGGTWATSPGNSSHPPDTVPQLMEVIVTGSTKKIGSTISGTIKGIVVVATDSGYGPNPGHPGTGRIVAVLCGTGE